MHRLFWVSNRSTIRAVGIIPLVVSIAWLWIIPLNHAHGQADFDEDWRELLQEQQYTDALPILEIAALEGDGAAALNLAQMYDFGLEVERNPGLAYAYYQLALSTNIVGSHHALASFLTDDTTRYLDYPKARELYKISSDAGNAKSLVALSIMYLTGTGGSMDLSRAFDLACQAMEAGEVIGFAETFTSLIGKDMAACGQ